MGASYISARAPWPTFADGRPLTRAEEVVLLEDRVNSLTVEVGEEIAESRTGLDLASWAADESPEADVDTPEERLHELGMGIVRELVRETITQMLEDLDNFGLEFDGQRWWVEAGGMTWGDTPDGFSEVQVLAAAGIGSRPLDGDAFSDVVAVGATVVVLDHLADAALRALRGAGVEGPSYAAAVAALENARLEVVPTSVLLRKALTELLAQRQSWAATVRR